MATEYNADDIFFSILIGAIPTASMLLASFALMNLKVQPLIEACFQNFCAGLILAAVAIELLPLMSPSETTTPFHSVVGTTLGFILGVAMINGVSQLIDSFENESNNFAPEYVVAPPCDYSCKDHVHGNKAQNPEPLWEMSPNGGRRSVATLPWMSSNIGALERSAETKELVHEKETTRILSGTKQSYGQSVPYAILTQQKDEVEGQKFDLDRAGCAEDGYDPEAILYAAMAIATPSHRAHIKEHLVEIMNAIFVLESNATSLMRAKSPLELRQSEKLAEEIDEEIHMLQYRLDHTRRLLEGSESEISAAMHKNHSPRNNGDNPSWWTSPEKIVTLEESLGGLKHMAQHLLEHIDSNVNITIPILREIHGHVNEMDTQLNTLHRATEDASFIWRRLAKVMGMPASGSFVPPSLIIPVAIDSFVDGFLIGVACALSRRAGWILALANCLEMAFLGMAVSMRVRKCTGSSPFVRYACIIVPPFIMLGSTVLGALVGSISKSYPILFVTFVAFGVIALLYLVCNELLAEARDAQEGDVRWWVTAVIFVGIYVVLMMDQVIS